MKTAIVTGAGGFIGGALTKLLLEKGVTVYGVDVSERLLEQHQSEHFFPIIADFTKYNTLHEQIPAADVFYHFAWQGVFGKAFQDYTLQLSNAKYACDALMAAVRSGCRKFVFAGTVNEYEMEDYIKADYFEPRYTYIYSVAKQVSEAICKTLAFNCKIDFCAGRIAMAYGENNRSMMLPNVVMKNLMAGLPCKLIEGNGLYDMVYIDDITNAFYAIGEKGISMKSYYIGHRRLTTFRNIMERIVQILAPDGVLEFGAYPDVPSGIHYDSIDREALYRDTGYECNADFDKTIMNTARWLKDQGSQMARGGVICKNYFVFFGADRRAVAA